MAKKIGKKKTGEGSKYDQVKPAEHGMTGGLMMAGKKHPQKKKKK